MSQACPRCSARRDPLESRLREKKTALIGDTLFFRPKQQFDRQSELSSWEEELA